MISRHAVAVMCTIEFSRVTSAHVMASTVSHCVTSIHCKIQEPMYQDGMPLLGCRCVHPAIRSRAASFLHSQTNTPAKGCEWIMRHSPRYVQPPVSSQLTECPEEKHQLHVKSKQTSVQGSRRVGMEVGWGGIASGLAKLCGPKGGGKGGRGGVSSAVWYEEGRGGEVCGVLSGSVTEAEGRGMARGGGGGGASMNGMQSSCAVRMGRSVKVLGTNALVC